MHAQWVEPSKGRADVIINSESGHGIDVGLKMVVNHLTLASGTVDDAKDEST